jgi:hypothetical protein
MSSTYAHPRHWFHTYRWSSVGPRQILSPRPAWITCRGSRGNAQRPCHDVQGKHGLAALEQVYRGDTIGETTCEAENKIADLYVDRRKICSAEHGFLLQLSRRQAPARFKLIVWISKFAGGSNLGRSLRWRFRQTLGAYG